MAKTKPTFSVWIGSAAYKVDDDGDGGVRLWQCQYWEEPTEDEIKQDVFEREVPDWRKLEEYEGMKLAEAADEWEGTLYASIEVRISEVNATMMVVVC
ncbi:MAG: hypothetical protein WC072_02805 [Methanoregulaceae archaeon]|jgi:hypothetical protein